MILYQLSCNDDHTFEAWFRDGGAYHQQARTGHVECPYCGSTQVAKVPVAAHIEGAAKPESLSEADINAASNTRAHEVAQQILDAVGKAQDLGAENDEDFADEPEDDAIDFVRVPASSRRND